VDHGPGRAKRTRGAGVLRGDLWWRQREVAGADWTAPAGNQLQVDLTLWQNDWPPFQGTFYATNPSTQPSMFAAFVGCVGLSGRAATAPTAVKIA
jgi:hypothetical protein